MSCAKNPARNTFNPVWEELYFCTEDEVGVRCLICLKTLHKATKFNVQRHYHTFHAEEYEDFNKEKRIAEIARLKADPPLFVTKHNIYPFNPLWEELYFFVEYGGQSKCLICLKTLQNKKKFNLRRHYSKYHEKQYGNLEKEERLAALDKLKERYYTTIMNERESEEHEVLEMEDRTCETENERPKVEFPIQMEHFSSLPLKCQPSWETYYFVEYEGAAKCLICLKSLGASKQFNMKRHYYKFHEEEYSLFSEEERVSELKNLKARFFVHELNLGPSKFLSEEHGDFTVRKENLEQKVVNEFNLDVQDVGLLEVKELIDDIPVQSETQDLPIKTENFSPISFGSYPKWESYFFIECNGIAKCLICLRSLSARTTFNMRRHYSSLHEKEHSLFSKEELVCEVKRLKANFIKTELSLIHSKFLSEDCENLTNKEEKVNEKVKYVQKFNSEWEYLYFFVQCNQKPKCLICLKTLSVTRKFNLERHYVTLHHKQFEMLNEEERRATIEMLKKNLFTTEQEVTESDLQSKHQLDDVKPDVDQLLCVEVKSEPMGMKVEPEEHGVTEMNFSCVGLDCNEVKEEIECVPDTKVSLALESQANDGITKMSVSSALEEISAVDHNHSSVNNNVLVNTSADSPLCYSCTICKQVFTSKLIYDLHSLIHKDCKYMCEHCDESFFRKDELASHLQIHVQHSCEICNKRLPSVLSLKRHKLMHLRDTRRLTCQKCNKVFPNASSFENHSVIHIGDRPYPCNVCGKKFVHLQSMKKHLLIHAEKAPYCCNICKRTFVQKHGFLDHKNRHLGNRLYLCDVCGKRFYAQRDLMKHLRVHSGDRRYICDVCNKSFYDKCDIIGHMRTHTGLRPYACEVCNKTFSRKDNLNTHKFLHQEVLPYVCVFCNKGFPQARNLKKHLSLH